MDTVRKLEKTVTEWYKGTPHLPKEVRDWLAENIWWLTLIGVILGAIAVLNLLFFGLLAGTLLSILAGPLGIIIGGIVAAGVILSLLLNVVGVVLGGMAITPLRARQRKGWTLLFALLLIEAVAVVVANVLSFNLFGLVWGLLWVAVGGYFLFELHEYFTPSGATGRKKVVAHQKK